MEFADLTDQAQVRTRESNSALTIDEIRMILRAEILCCEGKLNDEVTTVCGCDLMSDVLAFTSPGALLLTGLTNKQVVRTAEILDLKAIIFVRDKRPDDPTIAMAADRGIPLLSSPYPLFESCGLLFTRGLRGCLNVG
jgi:predicted transcriptional regulator